MQKSQAMSFAEKQEFTSLSAVCHMPALRVCFTGKMKLLLQPQLCENNNKPGSDIWIEGLRLQARRLPKLQVVLWGPRSHVAGPMTDLG
jgi:hypothetical protein